MAGRHLLVSFYPASIFHRRFAQFHADLFCSIVVGHHSRLKMNAGADKAAAGGGAAARL